MKKLTTTFLFLSCLALITSAQPKWQWGSSGGSAYSTDLSNMNQVTESITSMATDPNGNVYALARIARYKAYIGNDSSQPFNNNSTVPDYIAASWACDGKLRWVKSIGRAQLRTLVTDTSGGVYIMGNMDVSTGNQFDTDTIIAPQGPNVLNGNFFIKYDTSGRLQWLKMPDPNIVTIADIQKRPRYYHTQAAPNGDLFTLSYLHAGIHADGAFTVTTDGVYVLRYNRNGVFVSGVQLGVNIPNINGQLIDNLLNNSHFNRDHNNGRYYLTGSISSWDTLFLNSNQKLSGGQLSNIFSIAFEASGSIKWAKLQDTAGVGMAAATAVDGQGRLYIAGQIYSNTSWNGSVIAPPAGLPSWYNGKLSMGYVICMDSSGTNKWVSTGYDSTLTGGGFVAALAVSRNNEVRAVGYMSTRYTWGTRNLYNSMLQCQSRSNRTYNNSSTLVITLDAQTGHCTGLDSLHNRCGFGLAAGLATTDRNDNLYIGGFMNNPEEAIDTMAVFGNTRLKAVGGTTDFFVAKYGQASCKAATNSIANTNALTGLQLYPNPATNTLNVSGIRADLHYELYNNMGSRVLAGTLSNNPSRIVISSLAPGFYYVRIQTATGAQSVYKIIKQ